MEALIYWLVIVVLAVIACMPTRPRRFVPDVADLLSGLFSAHELGWPKGVQEEYPIRPWGAPVPSDGTATAGVEGQADLPDASAIATLEDVTEPTSVVRVHRAA